MLRNQTELVWSLLGVHQTLDLVALWCTPKGDQNTTKRTLNNALGSSK